MNQDIHLVTGAFRSGTTAMCHILGIATNAEVHVEDPPKMCHEARARYEGRSTADDLEAVMDARSQAAKKTLDKGLKYVDKNPNHLMFLDAAIRRFDSRTLICIRDGREVVRSMMDWHAIQGKSIFTLAEDDPDSDRHGDDHPWDDSLLRPRPGEPLHDKWRTVSRFEHCAWYWNRYNELALEAAERHGAERVMTIDMTNADVDTYARAFAFLGLEGFDADRVTALMQARINSVKWRSGEEDRFPHWPHWDAGRTARFEALAGNMMRRLGYL